jgi:hypothetical protein
VDNAAKWNGSVWTAAGAGLRHYARGLAVYDRPSVDQLYAFGSIDANTSQDEAYAIARFDGATWTRFGRIRYGGQVTAALAAITFDSGIGPSLYVCGAFDSIDGVPFNGIARWDGQSWHDVGGGFTYQGFPGIPSTLAVYDDGSGAALYVAGQYIDHAGGVPITRLARWNGESWSSVGSGLPNEPNWYVYRLAAGDAGRGPVLYGLANDLVGQSFTTDAVSWDGREWRRLGTFNVGSTASPTFVLTGNAGGEPGLFIGGIFANVNGINSTFLAQWQDCPPCIADCDQNESLTAADSFCYLGLYSAGDPRANCDLSKGPPVLTANDFMCFLNSFAAGFP